MEERVHPRSVIDDSVKLTLIKLISRHDFMGIALMISIDATMHQESVKLVKIC